MPIWLRSVTEYAGSDHALNESMSLCAERVKSLRLGWCHYALLWSQNYRTAPDVLIVLCCALECSEDSGITFTSHCRENIILLSWNYFLLFIFRTIGLKRIVITAREPYACTHRAYFSRKIV